MQVFPKKMKEMNRLDCFGLRHVKSGLSSFVGSRQSVPKEDNYWLIITKMIYLGIYGHFTIKKFVFDEIISSYM